MKLLTVIGTLNPTYGGPVEALRQFAEVVEGFGHEHVVLTLDSPDSPWLGEFPANVVAAGPSRGKYRYSAKAQSWLRKNITRFDAVIVRGIWQYQSYLVRRVAKSKRVPYFVFIHGALDPWFKRHYPLKHLKKWLYWPWGDYRVLRDAAAVLFTSDEERCLARKSFWLYKAREAVVDYGIRAPGGNPDMEREAFYEKFPELRAKRILLFLSRLHPKKGCDLLIQSFASASNQDPFLHLVMAGPDQEGWGQELARLAASLGVEQRITWTGMLKGEMKYGAFRAAEVFVLPSHSENFGVVVAEALSCGLPVLITDKVNIWREVEADAAGLVEADTQAGIQTLLARWNDMSMQDKATMSDRARMCFEKRFEIYEAVKTLLAVVQSSLEAEEKQLSSN